MSDIQTLVRANFATILDDLDKDGPYYEIVRQTVTTDTVGNTKSISETTFDVGVIIQDLTAKDRKLADMGITVSGDKRAFFKHLYGSNEVKEDDILKHKTTSKEWRIIKLTNVPDLQGGTLFKIAVIRSIHLEGS